MCNLRSGDYGEQIKQAAALLNTFCFRENCLPRPHVESEFIFLGKVRDKLCHSIKIFQEFTEMIFWIFAIKLHRPVMRLCRGPAAVAVETSLVHAC